MRPNESFLGQSVRSLQTMLHTIAQQDRRIPDVIPDGIYGPSTMLSVSAFQRKNSLPVNGITDQQTWEQIVRVYDDVRVDIEPAEPIEIIIDPGVVYQQGDAHPHIYLVQSILTVLSEDHNAISAPAHSGVMDDETMKAVMAFQQLAGLKPTGQVDKMTWKHLSRHFTLNVHHHTAPHRNANETAHFENRT